MKNAIPRLLRLLMPAYLLGVLLAFCNLAEAQLSDLTVEYFTNFSPHAYNPGGRPTNYSYRILNLGPNSAGTINTEFILSRDLNLGNGDDIPIGTVQDWTSTLPAGSGATISVSAPSGITGVTMPSVVGEFYVWIRFTHAAGSGRTDSNPGNNVAVLLQPGSGTPVIVTVGDTVRPTVTSIARFSPSAQTNNVPIVSWLVTFSETVTSVQVNDFTLVDVSGTITNEFLTTVSAGGGTQIQVSANTGTTGSAGELRLEVRAGTATIFDLAGNTLVASFTNGQPYYVDKARPVVTGISTVVANPRYSPVFTVDVTFSEPVLGFDRTDLQLTLDGAPVTLSNTVTTAPVSGSTYRVSGMESNTAAAGVYALTVSGSGVADGALNSGLGSVSNSWVTLSHGGGIIYVDRAYGGASSDGSPAMPFKTVAEGHAGSAAGDVISIASGNYAETITLNKPVTVEARNGAVTVGQ